MYTIAAIFILNQLSTSLLSTGAFEIYQNDNLVWSKLESGTLMFARCRVTGEPRSPWTHVLVRAHELVLLVYACLSPLTCTHACTYANTHTQTYARTHTQVPLLLLTNDV